MMPLRPYAYKKWTKESVPKELMSKGSFTLAIILQHILRHKSLGRCCVLLSTPCAKIAYWKCPFSNRHILLTKCFLECFSSFQKESNELHARLSEWHLSKHWTCQCWRNKPRNSIIKILEPRKGREKATVDLALGIIYCLLSTRVN